MRCEATLDMTSETMAKIAARTPDFEKDNSEEDIKTKEKLKGQHTQGQFVWCEYCEMLLTGPIQYNEHEIGKKHKKNIQGTMFQKILRPYASKE